MIAAAVVAVSLASASASVAELKAEFPGAAVIEAPGDGRLTHVSGFKASGLGTNPRTAALAFLHRYAGAFGVGPRQELVAVSSPAPGEAGAVRFQRRVDGYPIFDGDLVVGVDSSAAVILVNSADVSPKVTGAFRISRSRAVAAARAAIPRLESSDAPRAERGWKSVGEAVRPVWRVEFVARKPPGDWVTYVDAQSGKVLLRTDRRTRT